MAKRIDQLTELTTAEVDDLLLIHETSTGQTKKISVQNLTGIPDFGWVSTGESWSYSSFSTTTRMGVITVPSDATTKYQPGMRVRISQSTGGTKYGTIISVTSTSLTVYFSPTYTLNNEAISSPYYSAEYVPFGMPLAPVADANSWYVDLIGIKRRWYKRVAWSQTIGGADNFNINPVSLPAALSTQGTNPITTNWVLAASAYSLNAILEGNASSTGVSFTGGTIDGASRALSGYVDIVIIEA